MPTSRCSDSPHFLPSPWRRTLVLVLKTLETHRGLGHRRVGTRCYAAQNRAILTAAVVIALAVRANSCPAPFAPGSVTHPSDVPSSDGLAGLHTGCHLEHYSLHKDVADIERVLGAYAKGGPVTGSGRRFAIGPRRRPVTGPPPPVRRPPPRRMRPGKRPRPLPSRSRPQ